MPTENAIKIRGANERERERESKPLRGLVKFLLSFFIFAFCFLQIRSPVFAALPSTSYTTATITNPSSNLTDFTFIVDLSRMPASWWTTVDTSDGTKGRAAKDDGTELATDWINFDNVGKTGWLRVLWSGTLTSSGTQVLRIYPPVSGNSSYGATDTYGGNNAYASHWEAYYTLDEAVNNNAGGYKDRTKNARNGTGVSMALAASAGKIDNAQNFDGTADYIKYDNFTVDFTQGTILTWASNAGSVRTYVDLSPVSAPSTNRIVLYPNGTTLTGYINNANVASKTSAITNGTLTNVGFSWNTTSNDFELYVSGVAQNANLSVSKSLTTVARNLTIGSWYSRDLYFLSGKEDEVQIHSAALSAAWIGEEYAQTNNNTTFWGNWVDNPSTPSLVSPTNASYTADNTPTLSAQYTSGNHVGTTNYRIVSTSASDCLSGTNLITSGTSTETSTYNEATTFTPNSSIGSDSTYYWCAQNNNGTNTSNWTTMGSFTLNTTDTTPPSVPGTPTTTANTTNSTPTWTWAASTDSGVGLDASAPYAVKWSQDTNFVSGVSTSTSTTNSYTHSQALADGTWYFKASAKDGLGHESNYSLSASVVINTAITPSFTVNYVSTDSNGVKTYNMTSNYNGGGTHSLQILQPNNPAQGVTHNFLYLLPVSADGVTTYGDPMNVVRTLDAQNQYNLTIILPSFAIPPWYANSDSNNNYRLETFMIQELQPWVKANLATSENEQHWLIGFSKSGYGPLHLLFRNPTIFTLGAFWDFPADMTTYNTYEGGASNYGSQTNFDNNYRLTSTFLENHKTPFLSDNRIWINGYGNFRTHVEDFDALLTTKSIQHTTAPEVSRAHDWNGGWVPSALAGLYADSIVNSTEITTTDSGIDTSWHNSNVTVTLTCSDSSGSGCNHTYYTTDGTTPTTSSSSGSGATTTFALSTDGTHTIKYFSINNIGLQESVKTATNTVKIDKTTVPSNPTLSLPTSYTKDNTKPTLVFKKSSDSGSGISSYSVSLDDGKNKNYSTSGIPSSGNGTSNYIWKDDSSVKITFVNENDSDSGNDEIQVYFKGLDTTELSEGKHTWTVTAYDNASNSTSTSADFYIDKTSPTVSELAIANVSTVLSGVSYNLNITNRMPSFSGLATDSYQGSTVTNSNGTKDTFDKVSSGPQTITLTFKKQKTDQTYADYSTKDFSLSDIQDINGDKKSTRFYISTPFPLVDGYYQVTIVLKDSAGNSFSQPVFYLSLNASKTTNPLQNLFTNNLETKITNQETIPATTSAEKQQIQQNGYTVKVKVIDTQNKPVAGAKVTIHSKVQETTTDKNGIALFNSVESGQHRILIAYSGYSGEQQVNLTGDVKEFDFNIQVKQTNAFLNPQVISVIGVMAFIILVTVVLLIKAKRKV